MASLKITWSYQMFYSVISLVFRKQHSDVTDITKVFNDIVKTLDVKGYCADLLLTCLRCLTL